MWLKSRAFRLLIEPLRSVLIQKSGAAMRHVDRARVTKDPRTLVFKDKHSDSCRWQDAYFDDDKTAEVETSRLALPRRGRRMQLTPGTHPARRLSADPRQ